jgi:hypothetical protein
VNSRAHARTRTWRRDFCDFWSATEMKPINAWPLVVLLICVLFLIAWIGGYLA